MLANHSNWLLKIFKWVILIFANFRLFNTADTQCDEIKNSLISLKIAQKVATLKTPK